MTPSSGFPRCDRLVLGSLTMFALLFHAGPAGGTTYIIRPDGSGDFPTIQAGVDGSTSGDTLLLADGVFSGPGNRNLTMDMRATYIFAQSGQATSCAIDLEGEPLGTNGSALTEFKAIEIRNSRALTGFLSTSRFSGCFFIEPNRVATVQEGLLQLVECTVTGGTDIVGAGERVELVRCHVVGHEGAGLFGAWRLSAVDCTFESCASTGTLLSAQPWMDMAASLEATGCEFHDNVAPDGLLASANGCLIAEQCTFSHNQGPSLLASTWHWSDLTIQANGCTMADNLGLQEILVERDPTMGGLTLQLEYSIIAFRGSGCAVTCLGAGIATEFSCCDIFGNEGGDWVGCIAGHLGVDGNISEDPLFCGGAFGYRLQDESPCAPGGACAEQIGAWPVGCSSANVAIGEGVGVPLLIPYPNPSRDWIHFQNGGGAEVLTIDLFDAAGRWVRALGGGGHAQRIWTWDGHSSGGEPVPAGIYLFRARSATREQQGSVMLAR